MARLIAHAIRRCETRIGSRIRNGQRHGPTGRRRKPWSSPGNDEVGSTTLPTREARDDGVFPTPGGSVPSAHEEAALLYFAYTTRIAPDHMAQTAPGAEFEFIAHLPEWGLDFPVESTDWGGALPTVTPTTGSTVWGAVFNVDDSALAALDDAEGAEQRVRSTIEAMDRMGRRHQVVVHLHERNGPSTNGSPAPSAEYLKIMLDGSRHWSLPAGWIAGLEEHLQHS